jgi:hypothetical protein
LATNTTYIAASPERRVTPLLEDVGIDPGQLEFLEVHNIVRR